MTNLRTFLVVCALSPLAFAQLDSNSITVTASRGTSLQPDQVVFAVNVDTMMDVSLNDVVAVLQNAGITLSNFAGIRTVSFSGSFPPSPAPLPPQVEWTFGLPVPISKLTDTSAALRTIQQNVATGNKGWVVSFNVQGTQVSMALQQSQVCSYPDLIADARSQAQKVAAAAGMSVGNVLAISSGVSTPQASSGAYISAGVGTLFSTSSLIPAQICSAAVKFALK
jgi:uncharacterized protein YggE